jgi:phosphoribosyl 1,2-cyclic phosphodiesterase
MKIINLGSGSKGNATLIKINSGYILVDCGLSKFEDKLNEQNILLDEIKYVFITHNHRDHILNILKFDPSIIYCGDETLEFAHQSLEYYKNYKFDDFEVFTLKTSHDAPKPFGYIFKIDGSELVYMTDTGKILAKTLSFCKNKEFYILESNYDLNLLMESKRPLTLKNRIKSTKGHLSNLQCKTYLDSFIGDKTLGFALAHISEECNNDEEIAANLDYFSTNIKTYFKQWEPTVIAYDED